METSPGARKVRQKDAANTESPRVKDFGKRKKKIYSQFFRGKKLFWNMKEGWKYLLSCLWVFTSTPPVKRQSQKPWGWAALLSRSKQVWVGHGWSPSTPASPTRCRKLSPATASGEDSPGRAPQYHLHRKRKAISPEVFQIFLCYYLFLHFHWNFGQDQKPKRKNKTSWFRDLTLKIAARSTCFTNTTEIPHFWQSLYLTE